MFGCQCLPGSITPSLCIAEAIDLPLLHLKDDEKPHNARWMKNTIAIVCSAQKDGYDALLKASVYVRLHKPGNVFVLFFSSYVVGKKTQVFRFASTAAAFFF